MANKKTPKTGEAETLLVELQTEELPPKSLQRLSESFGNALAAGLRGGLLPHTDDPRCFATPRRLAVLIHGVLDKAPDVSAEASGPPVSASLDAAKGFARKHGVAVESLERRQTPKGEVYVARFTARGAVLDAVLYQKIEAALKSLPIPKTMRWGNGNALFARPVHGLVMLHGSRIVPGEVLGVKSSNRTLGHRFLSSGAIMLKRADDYERVLRDEGKVIVDFSGRRTEIAQQLEKAANGAKLVVSDALLDEISALVEAPTVYAGQFDAGFLAVPEECLILSMQQHQRYVPLRDKTTGKLLPRFLFVSNVETKQPHEIIHGNERVLRARLSDAKFFYDQDRKTRLEARVSRLAKVVYHNKLGSQLERVERIRKLAGTIAGKLKTDASAAGRAASLCKADLLTDMVGEFPELQGTIGRYYALHDGESTEISDAIEQHYRPRFAGDILPHGAAACAVALADKLISLAGLFGIGEEPTGEKDPFGLRRSALGLIRILVEKNLPLHLGTAVSNAFETMPQLKRVDKDVIEFIYERFAGYLKDLGFSTLQVEAVLSRQPDYLNLVLQQLEAVKAFQLLPEAESLAAANKRVANILRQAASRGESFGSANRNELKEAAEVSLFEALEKASGAADRLFEKGDYAGYLRMFAVLKAPIDAFFDKVMVMAEQETLRRNRLALLNNLRDAMNRFADISKLAA